MLKDNTQESLKTPNCAAFGGFEVNPLQGTRENGFGYGSRFFPQRFISLETGCVRAREPVYICAMLFNFG